MSTCVCDGSEDYDCPSILDNMDRLCFHKARSLSTSTSTTTAATISHHHHHTTIITAEGGGLGVEERNDTSSNSGGIGDRDRTGHGHGSGHHPDHQPHGAKTRPHHPHHPEATAVVPDAEDIETNEVEIRQSPSPPTARSPSRASSSLASAPYWLLLSAVSWLSGRLLL